MSMVMHLREDERCGQCKVVYGNAVYEKLYVIFPRGTCVFQRPLRKTWLPTENLRKYKRQRVLVQLDLETTMPPLGGLHRDVRIHTRTKYAHIPMPVNPRESRLARNGRERSIRVTQILNLVAVTTYKGGSVRLFAVMMDGM